MSSYALESIRHKSSGFEATLFWHPVLLRHIPLWNIPIPSKSRGTSQCHTISFKAMGSMYRVYHNKTGSRTVVWVVVMYGGKICCAGTPGTSDQGDSPASTPRATPPSTPPNSPFVSIPDGPRRHAGGPEDAPTSGRTSLVCPVC